jgi:hypothetical protein
MIKFTYTLPFGHKAIQKIKLALLMMSLALLAFASACGAASKSSATPAQKAATATIEATQKPAAPADIAPTATTPAVEMPVSPVSPISPVVAPKQSGKLTQRLQLLANDPALQTQDAKTQAEALDLPASGAGSLMRNNQGDILINIRLDALSQDNLKALNALSGLSIVHTTEEFRTVTAYVSITQLRDLAQLDFVEVVEEELMPQ